MTSLNRIARRTARAGLSLANRPVASARFSRAVMRSLREGRPLKVAVGAGNADYPGWINTDITWPAAHYLDLLKRWPVPAGSVSRIFADNVIEHFTIADGRVVLARALEALQPGGGIRLATPDVERTARAYLDGTEMGRRHLERHRKAGFEVHYPVDLLRVTFAEAGHHLGFLYDLASLTSELELAGFERVTRQEVGQSEEPDFTGLEQRLGPTEAATSLIVEAWKP